jgi:hypothetical protein
MACSPVTEDCRSGGDWFADRFRNHIGLVALVEKWRNLKLCCPQTPLCNSGNGRKVLRLAPAEICAHE